MRKIQPFTVIAELPPALEPLRSIATNLWWCWNQPAKSLFIRSSREGFARARRNPIRVIESLSQDDILSLAKDKGYIAQIDEVVRSFEKYRETRYWWSSQSDEAKDLTVAYFSAEYGLHESVPIYSGGLGVLAGDHLKAASDLGVPIVAVGLLYYQGYFSQYLNADGWQQESFIPIEIDRLPLRPALGPDGKQVAVTVQILDTPVVVKAWCVEVGLVKLYLLDTNVDENQPVHRAICARLYGGDVHVRIPQEIVLGIGGLRVLDALGIKPDLCHMNEGHSAFLAFEQIRLMMKNHGFSFEEALRAIRVSNLFTTHTMVAAGNDMFSRELIERYFGGFAQELGVSMEDLLKLGRVNANEASEPFSMTVLAIRASQAVNGVSELHGSVTRKLWQSLWPEVPLDEVPINHITNGVHTATWTSRDMSDLYDRYLGPGWRDQTSDPASWEGVEDIPDEELWRIMCRGRSSLVTFCRDRLREQLTRRGAGRNETESAAQVLDPNALTIGFARRFASYKRAALILRDLDRLIRIVTDSERPVQFIFSGKAHPADQPGKELIARLVHASHNPDLRGRFIFIDDYDMAVARKLVQGVDVWLNNPRRPLEASGTSGMKVSVNAGLNVSVLDGWWCEAFNGDNGWCIGLGEEYEDQEYQDQIESRSIYDILEREVIPTFYDRSATDIPREWLKHVKASMRTIAPQFSAGRMVSEYASRYYIPIGLKSRAIRSKEFASAREEQQAIAKCRRHWHELRILAVETDGHEQRSLGKTLPLTVTAYLGQLSPEDVAVEIRLGTLDVTNHLHGSELHRLTKVEGIDSWGNYSHGVYRYEGNVRVDKAGSYGFSARLVPIVHGAPYPLESGLITWWQ